MERPYANQKKAKERLTPGEYILFAENDNLALCSGVVEKVEFVPLTDNGVVTVGDLNGEGEGGTATFELSEITLYRGTDWEDIA